MSSQSDMHTGSFAAAPFGAVPWYCYVVVLGAACIPIGSLWDISWHESIGRDTFWTPAHMVIYLSGVVPGSLCGWLVWKDTFRPGPVGQSATVGLLGCRGPLGAWLTIFGSFLMLLSGPFDNWWHNAYGLDVQIVSPPHTVLAEGMNAVAIGALLLVASWQNRAAEPHRQAAGLLTLFACGILLTMLSVYLLEYIFPNEQHSATFYWVCCVLLPMHLIGGARVCRVPWPATCTALIYMGIVMAMDWILPLFPARPRLAPIYNPITHMVPLPFPLLLVVPAMGIDLLMKTLGQKRGFWSDTGLAFLLAAVFFILLLAVQWPFSHFLLSPASRNAFFGGNAMWSYGDSLGDWCTRYWNSKDQLTTKAAAWCIFCGGVAARLSLLFAKWLAAVQR